MGSFWKNWVTFSFNIWSHWIEERSQKPIKREGDETRKQFLFRNLKVNCDGQALILLCCYSDEQLDEPNSQKCIEKCHECAAQFCFDITKTLGPRPL